MADQEIRSYDAHGDVALDLLEWLQQLPRAHEHLALVNPTTLAELKTAADRRRAEH